MLVTAGCFGSECYWATINGWFASLRHIPTPGPRSTGYASMSIKSVASLLVAYPEPHYRNVERYLTLVRIEDFQWSNGMGRVHHTVPGGDPGHQGTYRRMSVGASDWLRPDEHRGSVACHAGPMLLVRQRRYCRIRHQCHRHGSVGLKGHLLGQPVASLLGGHVTDRVPAMASFILDMDDLDWTVDEFAMHQQSGFRILKAGWGMTPDFQFGDGQGRDLLLVDRIRAAVGYDVDVILDVAGHRRF